MARPSKQSGPSTESDLQPAVNEPVQLRQKPVGPKRRSPVSQQDVPNCSLDQALRVAKAIGDNYAFTSTRPLEVATALNMQPTSGSFRMMTGASIAYGLTDGGWNAASISVTTLAKRILEPTVEGDDLVARQEAILKPRALREFLTKYDRNRLPREEIARNVLVEIGVPRDSADRTLKLIIESARAVGFLRDIKGSTYVNLAGNHRAVQGGEATADDLDPESTVEQDIVDMGGTEPVDPGHGDHRTRNDGRERRVFITHGKNRAFVDTLKELLTFGELEPVVSVERETVSQPLPDKVMGDMRSCGAAIIHVDTEEKLIDSSGEITATLNANVLIEIGAAMALYGRRFVLLVKEGVKLPSNLQGLYEVRYDGEKLDSDATIRLLKAIRDIKNHPLPG